MKNVVIHKIVKFIFTEQQLKSYWESLGDDLAFDSLTPEQLMNLAQKMLKNASHSQLEQHTLDGVWRTEDEATGRLIAEDDSQKDVHIELIEASEEGKKSETLLIDRLMRLYCTNCNFRFFLRDLDTDISSLKCPKCGGDVTDKPSN